MGEYAGNKCTEELTSIIKPNTGDSFEMDLLERNIKDIDSFKEKENMTQARLLEEKGLRQVGVQGDNYDDGHP